MRRRSRQLALPILLIGFVAGLSLVLFGTSAHAESGGGTTGGNGYTSGGSGVGGPQPAAPSTTEPSGSHNHALGTTGGNKYSDTELGTGPASGRQLFLQACSSCHGTGAEGTARAPTLVGLGTAAVDFWVNTGRMPLEVPSEQAMRKNPIFRPSQAKAIAEYVGSLGPGGPSIPSSVDYQNADLSEGGELWRLNCSTCHSLTANGGALSYGAYAPSLLPDTPLDIAEAIRVGPGNMPRFTTSQLSTQDEYDIIRYVKYITHPDDRGGFNLGHVGPTTEGFIGIVVGVGLLMLAAFWIGDRT